MPAAVSPSVKQSRVSASRAGGASIALLTLFLAGYAAVTLVGEDFTAYDNSALTMYSLRGKDFPTPIWRESGRFFPFGLQEFNVVGRVSRTVAAYHSVPICEMLILVSILLVLDQRLSIAVRAVLAAFAILQPSVVLAFTGLIYAEANIMFCLMCVALSGEFFGRTRSVWWALAAILCAQVALYYKETVFIFLLTFAAVRILLRAHDFASIRANLRNAETRLDIALAAVSLIFAALYAIVVLADSRMGYLADSHVSTLQAMRAYLRSDLLIWIFSGVTLLRVYRVFRRNAEADLLWDGLACAALVYFAAFLVMGMVAEYYLAPADLIAVLYLGRYLWLSWREMRIPARAVTVLLSASVVVQSLDLTTLHIVERKFVVQRKALTADIIAAATSSDPARVTRLYFPFTPPYGVAEFAAYLSYRGVPLEEVGQSGRVELYGARIPQTRRCIPIRDFLCHAGPATGNDLVVVLPDDSIPPSESKLYQEYEHKLLAHDAPSRERAWIFRSCQFLWKYASLI